MMKKLVLCGMVLAVSITANAQQKRLAEKLPNRLSNKISNMYNPRAQAILGPVQHADVVTVPLNPTPITSSNAAKNPVSLSTASVTETIIGNTVYDLQTNRGPSKRISNNGDGTISAVWTTSFDRNTYPDRGSGYNYFDGSAWGPLPTARIETQRVGFTNISVTNGNEFVVTHNGTSVGVLATRPKGTGSWTETTGIGGPTPSSDVWWRSASGGSNNSTVHAIVNSQGSGTAPVLGQSGPLTYSRSQDNGATWDIQHIVLPGGDSTFYDGFSAENYHIDCRGDVVAIVSCDILKDVVLWKSTDNGTTWTKTIIEPSPVPAYNLSSDDSLISDANGDGIADTLVSNAGDPNVTLDNNNVAHVTWSLMEVLDDSTGEGIGIFLSSDGIAYWNENLTAPVLAAQMQDLNNNDSLDFPSTLAGSNPWGRYGNAGLSIHPQIGIDAANNVYLTYASPSELTDTASTITSQGNKALRRHVYVTRSNDGGQTWSIPLDVVPSAAQGGDGEFQECVFPSIAKLVDNNVHILYQRDGIPEDGVPTPPPGTPTNFETAHSVLGIVCDMVYVTVPVTALGVEDIQTSSTSFTISQNFPNPFSGATQFTINLTRNSNVRVDIFSVVGNLVKSFNYDNMNAGVNLVTLDASDLASGMYTYTVNVGNEKATRTMIVK